MPNPPITVGELTDVPAPESPINAQFMQEVANRIVHRFASVAAMNGWAAASGSMAYVNPWLYVRADATWHQIAYIGHINNLQTQIDALTANLATYPTGMIARTIGAQRLGITSTTEICRVTFTADPGRWYRTTAFVPILRNQDNTPGEQQAVHIFDAGSFYLTTGVVTLAQFESVPVTLTKVESGLSGSTVRKLVVEPWAGGNGPIDVISDNLLAEPYISVEDMGAV